MHKAPDKPQRKVLGKGLSALLPNRPPATTAVPKPLDLPSETGRINSIPILQIEPNPLQPQFLSAAEAIWKLRKSHHQSRPLLPR